MHDPVGDCRLGVGKQRSVSPLKKGNEGVERPGICRWRFCVGLCGREPEKFQQALVANFFVISRMSCAGVCVKSRNGNVLTQQFPTPCSGVFVHFAEVGGV